LKAKNRFNPSQHIKRILIGPPRDPLNPETRQHIVLIAFLAWVGLGADGLSSSAYGPEEAFKALGAYAHLGLFLAPATALTVFVIALAYNQVIELFPSGGGGYKVATVLIGPKAGLISGAALIVDYVLTITISIASGIDTLFSLLPLAAQQFKLTTEVALILSLLILNLRGVKESVNLLMPIFLGFVISHVSLILFGTYEHLGHVPQLLPKAVEESHSLSNSMGWVFTIALFLRAYSLGGSSYTGLEAISNNVNMLAEPRVRTGKWTMFYTAMSLAFTAAGIILLYLLWDTKPIEGQTMNAVVFRDIIDSLGWNATLSQASLITVLACAGALLFVAANTGFLGGPAVLANMAVDQWVPNQFSSLSSRLVTKHGVILMGGAALAILIWSEGKVDLLAVLYSINVFITFTMATLGLCIYWLKHRHELAHWRRRLTLSAFAFLVCAGILLVTLYERFAAGGWVTLFITGSVISFCLLIKRHYLQTKMQIAKIDEIFTTSPCEPVQNPPTIDPDAPTAVFMVSRSRGAGMHTMLWVQRLFPNNFKNFVFLSVGAVDTAAYGGEGALEKLQQETHEALTFYVNFCHQNNIAATAYESYGTDRVNELTKLVNKVSEDFSNCVFFASKLVFVHDNWLTRSLHNQTPLAMQRILHLRGQQMVILPMKID